MVRAPCALALVLVVGLAACRAKPSAELELAGPDAGAGVAAAPDAAAEQPSDERARAMCRHSYGVLSGENPSLRAADIERDFVERCVAGNASKRAELGEARWSERATCIEQASTSAELGVCDGRAPQPKVEVVVSSQARDVRLLCRHIIDLVIAEQPDLAAMLGPQSGLGLDTFVEDCTASGEEERRQDPARFDAMYDCIMAADQMTDFERCDDQGF